MLNDIDPDEIRDMAILNMMHDGLTKVEALEEMLKMINVIYDEHNRI